MIDDKIIHSPLSQLKWPTTSLASFMAHARQCCLESLKFTEMCEERSRHIEVSPTDRTLRSYCSFFWFCIGVWIRNDIKEKTVAAGRSWYFPIYRHWHVREEVTWSGKNVNILCLPQRIHWSRTRKSLLRTGLKDLALNQSLPTGVSVKPPSVFGNLT